MAEARKHRMNASTSVAITEAIRLDDVGGAMVVCARDGTVVGATPSGRSLLARMGCELEVLPSRLPSSLARAIAERGVGEALQWRPETAPDRLLGCTRYRLGSQGYLLVMSEISEKNREMARRMHQQRLEEIGRLVATMVHDLRSPLASIVFNADVLTTKLDELSPDAMRDALVDIQGAANSLRGAIDCLLDYVRLGPPVESCASLRDVLARVTSLLRPLFRAGAHRFEVESFVGDDLVAGNVLALEQIFVNLAVNAVEASMRPITVRIRVERYSESTADEVEVEGTTFLRVFVEDDGPGIAAELRSEIFEPFFTTKTDGTGLGLSAARDAARATGGDLALVPSEAGAAFAVVLPAATPRATEAA